MVDSERPFACSVSARLMKTKHLVYIMAFGVVTSNYDVMPPVIFPYSFRLNTEAYIKCLVEVV